MAQRYQLADDVGGYTPLGNFVRYCAGAIGILSTIAFVPASFLGLLSPMVCGGGCSLVRQYAVLGMMASVILLPIAAGVGFMTFSRPSFRLFGLSVAAASIVVVSFILAGI